MENKKSWIGKVETDVVKFMEENELEKITIEDGRGNKAKLTKRADRCIKIECTSTSVL